MRLSGLVVAAILFVSATLLAQHSSGAGGSSSGGSHSSSSGGSSSSSSASSHISSSSASHVASTGVATSHLSPSTKLSSAKLPSAKLPSAKVNAAPEKQGFRSFLRHPFKKSVPVQTAEFKRRPCRKAPCAVCPPGESSNGGACVLPSNICSTGQVWNGFACGTQYRFNDDCRALLDQLAAQQRQMRGQDDPGQSLRYQSLRQQYEQCLERSRFHGYSSAALFDAPLIGPRDDR